MSNNNGPKKFVNLGAAWKRSFTSKKTGEQETLLSGQIGGKNVDVVLWVQYPDGSTHQLDSLVIVKNKMKKEEKHPDYYIKFEQTEGGQQGGGEQGEF